MPDVVTVVPWPDPVLDVLGHDPRSVYAETFWLPTLGPTALLFLRHLADRFERSPDGVELPVAATAAKLGVGARDGLNSPLVKSLSRLQQFELACRQNESTIAVRRTVPPIHRRHLRRLPTELQERHNDWMAEPANRPIDLARRRARRLALTLLMQGERLDAVERALQQGGFHPALASEAVRWARERYAAADVVNTEAANTEATSTADLSSLPTAAPAAG